MWQEAAYSTIRGEDVSQSQSQVGSRISGDAQKAPLAGISQTDNDADADAEATVWKAAIMRPGDAGNQGQGQGETWKWAGQNICIR